LTAGTFESAGIRIRPARSDDLAACADTWIAGLDGYGVGVGRLPMAAAPASLIPLLAHLRATDPERFLVAARRGPDGGERAVAFASALRRADVWYLAMLFVDPGEQARGLGHALLRAVLPDPGDPAHRATCTDAAQPISSALYARYGIVPRVPVLELVGRPDRGRLGPLVPGIRAVPFEVLGAGPADGAGAGHLAAVVDGLDRATLGYAHPEDHAFLGSAGRMGYLYTTGDGRAVGYGYTSRVGRIGPIAVEDEALFPGVLGHLLGVVEPAGAFAAWVPGAAGRAVTSLLEAGLRLEDFPALLCWDRPFADFSRYVPITLAVL
jgi:GNAT superfamily N-acetyltransferase